MFVFVALFLFTAAFSIAAYYVWVVPQQQENDLLIARLRELRVRSGMRTRSAPDLVKREHHGPLASVAGFFQWLGVLRRLQEFIDQANMTYRATEVFTLAVLLFAGSWLAIGLFVPIVILRLVIAGLIGLAPIGVVLWKRSKRLRQFEQQLPDAIDLFNRSMKAGHNIHAGLETIAAETADPVKMEFRKVVEEMRLGLQVDQALHNLGGRMPLVDLKFFIIGLILQRQTGANMADVLDNLSLLVRERLNLMAKMKAHTAQQRFSAGLLCALPLVFAIGLWFLKPEYIILLYTDEVGSMFLSYAIVSEIVGILVIRHIANPKF
jgi:tight adherence protein B